MCRLPPNAPTTLPPGGVYVAVFRLRLGRRIQVGQLGLLAFKAGFYAYVGSAQRNLLARLRRHGSRLRKPLRWHIDYLSVRATMLGALVFDGPKALECRLARYLANAGAEVVSRFGCSDCRCRSHLFRL